MAAVVNTNFWSAEALQKFDQFKKDTDAGLDKTNESVQKVLKEHLTDQLPAIIDYANGKIIDPVIVKLPTILQKPAGDVAKTVVKASLEQGVDPAAKVSTDVTIKTSKVVKNVSIDGAVKSVEISAGASQKVSSSISKGKCC